MKRFLISFLLLLTLLAGTVFASGSQALPYAIRVNRAQNTVTIYTMDEQGQYTVPYKAMICSTARPGYVTPLGTYRLSSYRTRWQLMLDGTYGQYATSFSGNYLFHSICYSDDAHDAMVRESYNKLGEAASMGCVRLETIDAKWIYENCPAGTSVTVYEDASSPGPLGKPEPTIDDIPLEWYNGWDPTDPAEGNPWHTEPVTSLDISPASATLQAGVILSLQASVVPEQALLHWSSSDERVATVDQRGRVTALSAGTAVIVAESFSGISSSCLVEVQGELLPFDDLTPGAWYYPELRQALERKLFQGTADRRFSPKEPMTRAMAVQVLYQLHGAPPVKQSSSFSDVAETAWYYDAVTWGVSNDVLNGISEEQFAPNRPITRQELITLLWRYADCPDADSDLSVFHDQAQISTYAADAMEWAAETLLLQGSNGALCPKDTARRLEAALLLNRFAAAN